MIVGPVGVRATPILLLLVCLFSEAHAATGFHTSPACWDEPRIHAEAREAHVTVNLVRGEGPLREPAVVSPNGAYAFHVAETPARPGSSHFTLTIHIERPYVLEITFPDARGVVAPEWINERLLFVRVWWGRVAGTDYLIDVENETVVLDDPFRYGAIAFQQFKQCRTPEWQGTEACTCFTDAQEAWRERARESRE